MILGCALLAWQATTGAAGSGANGGVLPWWLVVPVTAIVMITVAAHVLAIQAVEMPASRRRIRTANGMLMLVTVPLLAYSVSVASPANPRGFVVVWVLVMALVAMIVFLAFLDMANTMRISSRERAELGRETAQALAREAAARRGMVAPSAQAPSAEPPERDHGT